MSKTDKIKEQLRKAGCKCNEPKVCLNWKIGFKCDGCGVVMKTTIIRQRVWRNQ